MPLSTRSTLTTRLFAIGAILVASSWGSAAHAFDSVNRWGATQIDGEGLQRGDPVTLRWSVVPDGQSYDRSDNSQLIQFLDDGWNVSRRDRGPDYTNRAWWGVINNAYAQYSRVSSIVFEYVPELTPAGVSTGMFGDIRLGGENIDGTPGGALADNVYPDGGDMRIDTTREADGSIGFYFSSEPGLRNLVIHETGHGVGLGHVTFLNNTAHAVMEPGLRTDIWGLQFDDIYGLNIQYGDPQERNGGNDTAATATFLGDLGLTGVVSVGLDASDWQVGQFDDDWLGIDGRSDVDWFRFTSTGEAFANINLTPQGPTYETEQQGVFNAAAQNNLVLQLYADGPEPSLLTTVNKTGVGLAEQLKALYLPEEGDYFVRVSGGRGEAANQFYRLDVSLTGLPEPGTSADLNLDGTTDLLDWSLFVANAGSSTALLSQRDAFMRGDLDLDGDNDYLDFKLFKSGYSLVNGLASLAGLTTVAVPEPGGAVLGLMALAAFFSIPRAVRQELSQQPVEEPTCC